MDVERWQIATDQILKEQDVSQRAIIVPGINKLVDNVFMDMQQTTKAHQEVTYYMGIYQ